MIFKRTFNLILNMLFFAIMNIVFISKVSDYIMNVLHLGDKLYHGIAIIMLVSHTTSKISMKAFDHFFEAEIDELARLNKAWAKEKVEKIRNKKED